MLSQPQPFRSQVIKENVVRGFHVNRSAVAAFQNAGYDDPTRGAVSARTQAQLKMWTAFELYKVQTLRNYIHRDIKDNVSLDAREESFAYYEAVQDVMRAMIYGATFDAVSNPDFMVAPEFKSAIASKNPYAEAFGLLAQMPPPANNPRCLAIQTDLARLIDGLKKTNGNLGAVELQIDPHRAVSVCKEEALLAAGEAVRQAREAARGTRDFTPD